MATRDGPTLLAQALKVSPQAQVIAMALSEGDEGQILALRGGGSGGLSPAQ
jgi:hypothetical protein